MVAAPQLLVKFPLAIASLSLGRASAGYTPAEKLRSAALAGYQGVEVAYEDLKVMARSYPVTAPATSFEECLIRAAIEYKGILDEYRLIAYCLQPFRNYEGLTSATRHAQKVEKMKLWIKLSHILGAGLIQIPAQFHAVGTTGDDDKVVADIREVVDLGAPCGIKFTYEQMAWAPYNSTWQDIWRIIQKVDRPNFGMLVDTYQWAARVWADIESRSGVVPNADAVLRADIADFVATVPTEKIFFIQLCDGERLDQPLTAGHPWYDKSQNPYMSWSRNARLFPYETNKGGYLPVESIAAACLVTLAYRGWVSFEIFNRELLQYDVAIPQEYAERGIAAWKTMVERLDLERCI
ncbi:xylose isomerase-like protein [Limtongia smithiae]|uniref:xylose isomerase-like protein n=1 Tax=Limtongia smithiae TaxID=1125753 RepID=UPI0034CF3FA5